MAAGGAIVAGVTVDALRDGYPVIHPEGFHAGAGRRHHPGRVIAQHQGQDGAITAAVLPHLQVQGAVHRNGVNLHQNFPGAGGRRGRLLPLHNLGVAEPVYHHCFQGATCLCANKSS